MDRLVPDPENERKTFSNMSGLMASIEHVGIVEPPVVKPLPDGRYQLLTGHRRWAAAQHLGYDSLDVVLRDPDDDDRSERRLKSLISNLQREAVPPLELAETLQSLLDDPNGINSRQQLARSLGKSPSWVSDLLGLLRFTPDLQEKIRSTKTPPSMDALSKIARVDDYQTQAALLDRALEGIPSTAIRREIQQSVSPQAPGPSTSARKSKQHFRTQVDAAVIIQSQDETALTPERQRAALRDALEQIED